MDVSELDTTSWTTFGSALALRVGQLGDNEFVSVLEPSFVSEPAPKRGLFGRLFGGVFGNDDLFDGGAFVQTHRTEQLLYVECVGARSFGGRHAWTPAQEAMLERVGWVHRPESIGERVYVIGHHPELNGYVPIGEARTVAGLMVATMRDVVGIADPASLDVRLG